MFLSDHMIVRGFHFPATMAASGVYEFLLGDIDTDKYCHFGGHIVNYRIFFARWCKATKFQQNPILVKLI